MEQSYAIQDLDDFTCSLCLQENRADPLTVICLKNYSAKKKCLSHKPSATTISLENPIISTQTNFNQFHKHNNNNNIKLSACTKFSNNNNFCSCHCNTTTTKVSNTQLFVSNKRKASKFNPVFFLVFCAILIQTTCASPVKASGKHLILHTNEYRARYHHNQLHQQQQQQRTEIPTLPHHRHHLHHRSAGNMPADQHQMQHRNQQSKLHSQAQTHQQCLDNWKKMRNATADIWNTTYNTTKEVYRRINDIHNITLGQLNGTILPYHHETLDSMSKTWREVTLNISNPYNNSDINNLSYEKDLETLRKETGKMFEYMLSFNRIYSDFMKKIDHKTLMHNHNPSYVSIIDSYNITNAQVKHMCQILENANKEIDKLLCQLNPNYESSSIMENDKYYAHNGGELISNTHKHILDFKLFEEFLKKLEIFKKILNYFFCFENKVHVPVNNATKG